MIRLPGSALSIAAWIALLCGFSPATYWGLLRWVTELMVAAETVTIAVSMDCLPLAALITSSPHCAGILAPEEGLVCSTEHEGMPEGTPQVSVSCPAVLVPAVQLAATPPIVTVAPAPKP